MKIYGAQIAEQSSITNLTVPNGTVFPDQPNIGELFYKIGSDCVPGLYIHNGGTWSLVSGQVSSTSATITIYETVSTFAGRVSVDLTNTKYLGLSLVWIDHLILQNGTSDSFTAKYTVTGDTVNVYLDKVLPFFSVGVDGNVVINTQPYTPITDNIEVILQLVFRQQ